MVVVYSWTHDGSVPCILFWSCRISDAQPEVVISITAATAATQEKSELFRNVLVMVKISVKLLQIYVFTVLKSHSKCLISQNFHTMPKQDFLPKTFETMASVTSNGLKQMDFWHSEIFYEGFSFKVQLKSLVDHPP